MRIQRSAEHRVVPWANGLGVTADVFLSPAGSDEWTWRLSIADVSDDLPFSFMPGIDRHIVVAQGAGMALTIDGAAEVRMERTSPPLSFAGEFVTTCRLLDGPIADLNLMIRRGRAIGALSVVSVPAATSIPLSIGAVATVVLEGTAAIAEAELRAFDAVLLEGTAGSRVEVLSAGPTGARVAIATVHHVGAL
jgi:environmental stress-induced protein Ves